MKLVSGYTASRVYRHFVTYFTFVILCVCVCQCEPAMLTDDSDKEKCSAQLQQQAVDTMTTDDKYIAANELLQQVDVNIVKTATLRKQMPVKCAQLLARRCRHQLSSLVSLLLF